VIRRVEADEGYEQANVSFGQAVTDEKGPVEQEAFQSV
jgi:hypothetical protein